jgi:hypothetical protein
MTDRLLLRRLVLAVLIKLLVLTGLWWQFVREARVTVDVEAVVGHLSHPQSSSPEPARHDE